MRQQPHENPRQPVEQPRQPLTQQPVQRPPTQPQPANQQPPQSFSPVQPTRQPPQGQPVGYSPQPAFQQQQPPQAAPAPQHTQQSTFVPQQGQNQAVQSTQQPPQRPGRGSYLATVSLSEILRENVVTASPETPVATITSQMRQEGVGSVVIVDDSELQGIVTDREIALALEEIPDLSKRTASEIMSDQVTAGRDTMSIHDALQRLREENIRRLPITDDNNTLVGIISLDDIMVFLGTELQAATDIIEAQSPQL